MDTERSGPDDRLIEGAMASGSDDGEPGERRPVDPDDEVAAAVEDDAPLRSDRLPPPGPDEPVDDATPEFREP